MHKLNFLKRLQVAYNAYTGRFTQMDKDGWPVHYTTTNSGQYITAEAALYATSVFACVNLLSSVIASMPVKLKHIKQDTIEDYISHSLYNILLARPNNHQTAYEYWLYNMECILLRGGFISWVNRNSSGKILELIPLHPNTVTRKLDANGKIYFSGEAVRVTPALHLKFKDEPQENFFWANYRTLDGLTPCSPIKYAAQSINISLSAENHGAKVLENDATPPLVIQSPEKLKAVDLQALAMKWEAGGKGSNYGKPRFLDQGATIERLSMSNEDVQYMETRRFQKEDICGIFRVPPSMIGDTQRAQGWSTLEQKNSDFLTYTLNPYLVNIEQAINRDLIHDKDKHKIYADFDASSLLRADIKTKTTYYTALKKNGILTANEIRKKEGINKIDGGDILTETKKRMNDGQNTK